MAEVGRLPVHALSPAALESLVAELGLPRYRTEQVLGWVYRRGVSDPVAMTELPKPLREALATRLELHLPEVRQSARSLDGTTKLALRLDDDELIESVLIPDGRRLTLCVSSQVGCAMGCGFCATARLGLRRQLRVEEMVGQVMAARQIVEREGRGALTNLVFMGMGEPLHNFDRLVQALEILVAPWGLCISPRRITVSTVGLLPEMRRLLEVTRVNLAVSLGATTDEVRRELMPITRRYGLAELLETCRTLPLPRRKRITFEYTLLEGRNDTDQDARRLVRLLHGIRAKVNLIFWNPFPDAPFARCSRERMEHFQRILLDHGLNATIRESRGPDIGAACGQLAAIAAEGVVCETGTQDGV